MANTDALFHALNAYYPVSADLREHLSKVLACKDYPKGHLLLKPGRTPAYAWFLSKGAARGFAYDEEKAEEVTTWFWLEGEVIVALDSFCRQVPTSFSIELLADSELHSVSYRELERVAGRFPAYRQLERAVVEAYLLRIYRHYYERSSLPARARYEKLMEERPRLFQVAPIKDIASFLGLFPDTLSKLRSQR